MRLRTLLATASYVQRASYQVVTNRRQLLYSHSRHAKPTDAGATTTMTTTLARQRIRPAQR